MDNRRNSSARAERNRFKYGICCNRDMNGEGKKCPNCESGEVFKIRATEEFVCPECGEALKEVPGPKTGGNKKLYAIIAAVIVVASGASCFLFSGKSDNPEQQIVEQTDTTAQEISNSQQDVPVVEEPQVPEIKTEDVPANVKAAAPALDWGKYDGPVNASGEPHGTMGTVIVTKTHMIDLKTSDGKTVTVNNGDKIIDCKFLDGRLVRGEIHFANGERQVIEIG